MSAYGDVYKVGFTAKSPKERAEDLSKATGVPLAYVVVHSWHHQNARGLEQAAHAALDDIRVSPQREFFKAPFVDRTISYYSPECQA